MEGGRRRGWQRKCRMGNSKEWTSLPMPELLTRASRKKKMTERGPLPKRQPGLSLSLSPLPPPTHNDSTGRGTEMNCLIWYTRIYPQQPESPTEEFNRLVRRSGGHHGRNTRVMEFLQVQVDQVQMLGTFKPVRTKILLFLCKKNDNNNKKQ